MSEANAKAATPHHELIRDLLDSRIPKTEREHAAVREIERLERRIIDQYRYDRRERIATAALQGLMASMHCMFPGELARDAVDYADALIAELDKPEEEQT